MRQKIKNWLSHIWSIISEPRQFFTKIVADGNLEESMLKSFIYGLLGGIFVLIIKLISGSTVTLGSVFSALIIIPVLAVTLLFIIGGLLMLISEITNGERDWEIAVKGLASVFFVYPVILILNALAFNCTSIWIISLIVDGYILFLIYNIGLYCMKGKKNHLLLVIGILALFVLTVYITDYHIGWLMLKNTNATLACLL